MVDSRTTAVVTLTVFALFAAFSVPTLITASQDEQEQTLTIETGETRELTDRIGVTLIESDNTEATVEIEELGTGNTDEITLSENSTEEWAINGDSGDVTLIETTNNDAEITVSYSPTYGYSEAGKTIVNNIGLLIIAVIFIVVMGFVRVVTP